MIKNTLFAGCFYFVKVWLSEEQKDDLWYYYSDNQNIKVGYEHCRPDEVIAVKPEIKYIL